jgi:hypothetical protein
MSAMKARVPAIAAAIAIGSSPGGLNVSFQVRRKSGFATDAGELLGS